MADDTIPTRSSLQTITADFFNIFKTVLIGDLIPRDSAGVAGTEEGSLGDSSNDWLRAHIRTGYFNIGDIMPHHTYNGAAPIGQGWMQCDGRLINEANYNTEHSATDWDTYVVSSALDGKRLPDLTGNVFPVGVTNTTEDGSSPLTQTGNASNQINLQHSHTVTAHNHIWYQHNEDSTQADGTYDSGGSLVSVGGGTVKTTNGIHVATTTTNATPLLSDSWTTNESPTTNNALSTTQNIQPRSEQVIYIMRVI